jgi:hypothetical protein
MTSVKLINHQYFLPLILISLQRDLSRSLQISVIFLKCKRWKKFKRFLNLYFRREVRFYFTRTHQQPYTSQFRVIRFLFQLILVFYLLFLFSNDPPSNQIE